jgi:hypothetical protein
MKPALIIVAAATLCGGPPAWAQTSGNVAAAPPSTSTGPTVPDIRQIDQNTIRPPGQPPSSSATPTNANPTTTYGNWRTSDGLDADPNNPSGAPGNSSVGISPSR